MSDARAITADRLARCHLRWGWTALLVFAVLGLALETLHGFKVRAYLDVSNDTRRLMWTLAHAHGALLGVLNVLYGVTVSGFAGAEPDVLTSRALRLAAVLLPAGFFLGGVNPYGGDPGLGVLLVPAGAAALIVALARIVRDAWAKPRSAAGPRSARR